MSEQKSPTMQQPEVAESKQTRGTRKKDRRVVWLLIIWGSLFLGIILMYWLG